MARGVSSCKETEVRRTPPDLVDDRCLSLVQKYLEIRPRSAFHFLKEIHNCYFIIIVPDPTTE